MSDLWVLTAAPDDSILAYLDASCDIFREEGASLASLGVQKNGQKLYLRFPQGCDVPPLPDFLGTEFITNDGARVAPEALQNKVIGIYYSRQSCPACVEFTPKLVKLYNGLKRQGRNFEVIFCSGDPDEGEFSSYFAKMPWVAMPFGSRQAAAISERFEIKFIPTLILLREDGQVITTEGVQTVDAGVAEFPWYVQGGDYK